MVENAAAYLRAEFTVVVFAGSSFNGIRPGIVAGGGLRLCNFLFGVAHKFVGKVVAEAERMFKFGKKRH